MAHSFTVNNAAIKSCCKTRTFLKLLLRSPPFPLLPIPSNSTLRTKPICFNLVKISSFHCYRTGDSTTTKIFPRARRDLSEATMTVTATPCIKDGSLMINGKVLLIGVPSNVAVYSFLDGSSASAGYLGASSIVPSSRHVFSLGFLRGYRLMCLFRHKIWWMIPRFGNSGNEIPMETQMLLLEVKEDSVVRNDDSSVEFGNNTFYVLLLPVLEGQFRATLQGTSSNELQFCIESGDAHVQTTQVTESVFVNSGNNPFALISNSIELLERHKGTFAHIKHKKKPSHLDWFGWCTWDAFYKDVNPQGIVEGLESFVRGGCPSKFLIIDDGWQDTINEFQKDGQPFIEGTQFSCRLVDIKENTKFMGSGSDNVPWNNLHDLVKFIKEKYDLKFVYIWHALIGYWGGLLPSSEKMKKYNPKITYPVQSPGNVGNLRDIAMDYIEKYGVGLIDPQKTYDFFNDLHSYLSKCGVDGVKVDVQNLIETLGKGHGGRVSLTFKYQEGLEESVARNFKENNLICCMNHNSDSIFRFAPLSSDSIDKLDKVTGLFLISMNASSRKSATARASEDFMPREPTFQTLHIASVAFNSLLLGEIVVPDWDMFQSNHYAAVFHGAARALGGCAVYVSDKPGMQDFKILKKLVLPDGSILRAKCAGRPTRDCLFVDTVMDGKSLLKIWNLNKLSGVIGIFNCQGAGSWQMKDGPEYESISSSKSLVLSGNMSPSDIEFLGDVADESWKGDCAVYAFHTGSLSRLSKDGRVEVCLRTLECEIFTISPIRVVNDSVQFTPIGLIDMYNSGGATESLVFDVEPSKCIVQIEARGCGRFGVYSSKIPSYCTVDGKDEDFTYDAESGLLMIKLDGECKIRGINICY